MKLHRYAACTLALALTLSALPLLGLESAASVAEGTVKKIDSAGKTLVITTKDGAEHTFRFVSRTTAHGVQAAGMDSKQALRGLKEGSDVAVHYATKGSVDIAKEVDYIGKDGLRISEGTVKKIDRDAKTITIATTDGAEETYRLTARAARDTGRDIENGAEKSSKVAVYYSQEGSAKVAHFFKSTL
jgi:Cu/Ag efflux protein CusF